LQLGVPPSEAGDFGSQVIADPLQLSLKVSPGTTRILAHSLNFSVGCLSPVCRAYLFPGQFLSYRRSAHFSTSQAAINTSATTGN
jgi:hypothetical protein